MINKQIAVEVTGGLSRTTKMPCSSWSISARMCRMGKILRENVDSSICANCYALKGFYFFGSVQDALSRRYGTWENPLWVESMVFLIQKENKGFFRWFDSGDVQSLEMLEKMVEVAKKLKKTKFWLPTKEYSIVAQYVEKHGKFPSNLNVRISAYLIDGKPPTALAKRLGVTTSTVVSSGATCIAPKQNGECGDCRKCWSKRAQNISYKKH